MCNKSDSALGGTLSDTTEWLMQTERRLHHSQVLLIQLIYQQLANKSSDQKSADYGSQLWPCVSFGKDIGKIVAQSCLLC